MSTLLNNKHIIRYYSTSLQDDSLKINFATSKYVEIIVYLDPPKRRVERVVTKIT